MRGVSALIKGWSRSYAPIDYAKSSDEKYLLPPWSTLGAMLSNTIGRALYVVPVAGYLILYSDYFRRLFRFSVLSGWGFLTFIERIDMIYYCSLTLLFAFFLFGFFRRLFCEIGRDRVQFVTDLPGEVHRGLKHARTCPLVLQLLAAPNVVNA